MPSTPILFVRLGDPPPAAHATDGPYERWFARGMGLSRDALRVVDPRAGDPLPSARDFRGVVVSGSASMVTARERWSERTGAWLAPLAGGPVPLLAVCYGHQLLAHALGGEVRRNPRGRQIGTLIARNRPLGIIDPLLGALGAEAAVQVSHSEHVATLPPGATPLTTSPRDAQHAYRIGERTWGVQFHPEIDARTIRPYLTGRRTALAAEGLDADALLASVSPSPAGAALLRRFREIALGR